MGGVNLGFFLTGVRAEQGKNEEVGFKRVEARPFTEFDMFKI